jgi:hypothetical protein
MNSLPEEFEKRGPWITRFWVDGTAYGGTEYDPTDDARIAMFKRVAGPLEGKRVLELGPLERPLTAAGSRGRIGRGDRRP